MGLAEYMITLCDNSYRILYNIVFILICIQYTGTPNPLFHSGIVFFLNTFNQEKIRLIIIN